jgi:primosomal protein N' (replication factor Y)
LKLFLSSGNLACTIKERYGKVLMPAIELVDLKDKYFRKKMNGHFSDN